MSSFHDVEACPAHTFCPQGLHCDDVTYLPLPLKCSLYFLKPHCFHFLNTQGLSDLRFEYYRPKSIVKIWKGVYPEPHLIPTHNMLCESSTHMRQLWAGWLTVAMTDFTDSLTSDFKHMVLLKDLSKNVYIYMHFYHSQHWLRMATVFRKFGTVPVVLVPLNHWNYIEQLLGTCCFVTDMIYLSGSQASYLLLK